jgi:transcriptional regulator with XRE-family HTH domain
MNINQVIASNILRIRKEKNIKQSDFVKLSGLSVSHIQRLENGQFNTTVNTLEKISQVLKVNIEDLVSSRQYEFNVRIGTLRKIAEVLKTDIDELIKIPNENDGQYNHIES